MSCSFPHKPDEKEIARKKLQLKLEYEQIQAAFARMADEGERIFNEKKAKGLVIEHG